MESLGPTALKYESFLGGPKSLKIRVPLRLSFSEFGDPAFSRKVDAVAHGTADRCPPALHRNETPRGLGLLIKIVGQWAPCEGTLCYTLNPKP